MYQGFFFVRVMGYNINGDIGLATDVISHYPNEKLRGKVDIAPTIPLFVLVKHPCDKWKPWFQAYQHEY